MDARERLIDEVKTTLESEGNTVKVEWIPECNAYWLNWTSGPIYTLIKFEFDEFIQIDQEIDEGWESGWYDSYEEFRRRYWNTEYREVP
jgi:hypothetical protein